MVQVHNFEDVCIFCVISVHHRVVSVFTISTAVTVLCVLCLFPALQHCLRPVCLTTRCLEYIISHLNAGRESCLSHDGNITRESPPQLFAARDLLHRLVLSVQHFLSHPILRFSTALRESLGVTCANMWSFKLVARDTWLLVCLWLVYIVSN